jgi:hypothetical protein
VVVGEAKISFAYDADVTRAENGDPVMDDNRIAQFGAMFYYALELATRNGLRVPSAVRTQVKLFMEALPAIRSQASAPVAA